MDSGVLLSPWSTSLLQKLIVSQSLKKVTVFYGTSVFHYIVLKISPIDFIPSQMNPAHTLASIPLRYILILSSHLHLCFASDVLQSGFPISMLLFFGSDARLLLLSGCPCDVWESGGMAPSFLILVLDGDKRSVSPSSRSTPGKEHQKPQCAPEPVWALWNREKYLAPCRESNPVSRCYTGVPTT
jgi:hypothetical protein